MYFADLNVNMLFKLFGFNGILFVNVSILYLLSNLAIIRDLT